jgi:hypothetical protein
MVTAAGIVLGMSYVLSPAAVWFALAGCALVFWSASGLHGRERRAMLACVSLALVVRAITVALFFLSVDHAREPYGLLIGDEMLIQWRALWLRNIVLGVPIAASDWTFTYQDYGETGLTYAFAYLHALLGPSPYGLHLFNVLLFVAGAILMHKIVRPAYGALPALCGLALVLSLPSLFVWSVSVLKEPAFFFLTALALASIVTIFRGERWWVRVLAIGVAIVSVNAVATIRSIGKVATIGGLALGVAARIGTLRAWLCLAAVALVLLVGARELRRPDRQAQIVQQLKVAVVSHLGNVNTEGYAYKLMDPRVYSRWRTKNDLDFLTFEESMRYVFRALASFVLVPLPWQMQSRSALAFLPEQIAWYGCVLLAAIGIGAGLRRDAWVTFLITGYSVVAAAVISLPSGNIGTFIRMRDMVVPFALWLSALGACVVVQQAVQWLGSRPSTGLDRDTHENPLHATAR